MPEDGLSLIGWRDFETEDGVNIANDAAVRASSSNLINETAAAARFGRLETARQAVQEAAERKALRDPEQPGDLEETFDEGSDFFG